MGSTLSLSPVSQAIYGALNVPAFAALCPGGAYDDLPQGVAFPCVLFTVSEDRQLGGFGTYPGQGHLPEVRVRLHVFSVYQGFKQAQDILAKTIELLAVAPAVSGYSSWAIFWDDALPLVDETVNDVKVKELVANARLYVEEA